MIRLETLIELTILNSSFFELGLLLKLDRQFPVERFEATVAQSTVPSPPLNLAQREPSTFLASSFGTVPSPPLLVFFLTVPFPPSEVALQPAPRRPVRHLRGPREGPALM